MNPCLTLCCFVYRKGTIFQANHNLLSPCRQLAGVVLYTAKVRFFKQITTQKHRKQRVCRLFCIPQRYDFSSKSQQASMHKMNLHCCFVYRKGTIFQANHNNFRPLNLTHSVVLYTAKVRFFKQITTHRSG